MEEITTTTTVDERFEKAWLAYNRKGAKKVALAQWEKLSEENKALAEKHIFYYTTSRERMYCKDFERYLRDHVFENPVYNKRGDLVFDPDAENTEPILEGFQG